MPPAKRYDNKRGLYRAPASVPSLKDLAFLALPSKVPSLKQLARAAVAANRPPLPAHTLARRRHVYTGDVVPVLVRRLWEAIWQAVAKTTHFGNDVLTLLTPNLEWWRRSPNSLSWKLDIPRPPRILSKFYGEKAISTEDQWNDRMSPPQYWNWNTMAMAHERTFNESLTPQEVRDGVEWNDRTRARKRWESYNIPLGEDFQTKTNWWSYTFGDKPINKRRTYEEDFDILNPLSGYLGNKVNPRTR
jgi:hypothetical protein